VMYDRISYEKNGIENMRKILEDDLYKYSCEGLRTLVMTKRNVKKSEYKKFRTIYDKLMCSNHPDKEDKLLELYDAMERKLRYLGSTAIEDKL
jgi:magnesium-transporting ATPase (P-type)